MTWRLTALGPGALLRQRETMMRPAFTRVAASKGKRLVSGACTQVPPMADGVLRWLGTTPATSCRLRGVRGVGATSGPTPSPSASTVAHKQQWQMQVVQVRFLSTMPEDELKRRMGTLMSDRTAVSPPCGSAPKQIIVFLFHLLRTMCFFYSQPRSLCFAPR